MGDNPWPLTSGFVATCPRLTGLTIIYPHRGSNKATETGYFLDPVGIEHSATSELVKACNALPDFDTFQIVHLPPPMPEMVCGRAPMDGLQDRARPQQPPREYVDGEGFSDKLFGGAGNGMSGERRGRRPQCGSSSWLRVVPTRSSIWIP
jgi:hypothetical protein